MAKCIIQLVTMLHALLSQFTSFVLWPLVETSDKHIIGGPLIVNRKNPQSSSESCRDL
jgi:hypothetical protein